MNKNRNHISAPTNTKKRYKDERKGTYTQVDNDKLPPKLGVYLESGKGCSFCKKCGSDEKCDCIFSHD